MSIYINSEVTPIGKLISSDTPIRVPAFQRSYSWTDEEVKQLWIDITEAIDSKDAEYFLGPMVVKKGDKFLEIIDGQQRITTIFIILSVIRRMLRENGDPKRADLISYKYFGEDDFETLALEPRFQMNEENDIMFQKYVVADTTESKIKSEMKNKLKKDTNYLLLQAISVIWESLIERQKSVSLKDFDQGTLFELQAYLNSKIHVLLLKVEDEADAFVIFETLNDRGKSLNTIDLLKNHVFGHAGTKYINQAKNLWAAIRENLAEIDPSEKFLYQYWASIHGRTPKAKLFRLMRKEINDAKSAIDFIKNINDTSRVYAALNSSGHPFWDNYDQRTRDNLDTLKMLDTQQAIPIMLAAAKVFTPEEFRKLTDILIVMTVRYNLIGELRTGVLANYYSEVPAKITNGEILKAAKVFREFRTIYPKDQDFKDAFLKKSLKDTRKARYILAEIEKHINGGVSAVVNDPKNVNLEHILPKNPSQDWNDTIKTIDKDDLPDYTVKIGNLALVSTASNKNAGSKGFESKKETIFNKEKIITFTKMIGDYSNWTKSTIEDRQSKLADQAVKVWKIEID